MTGITTTRLSAASAALPGAAAPVLALALAHMQARRATHVAKRRTSAARNRMGGRASSVDAILGNGWGFIVFTRRMGAPPPPERLT